MRFDLDTLEDDAQYKCTVDFTMSLSTPKFVEDFETPDGYVYDAHLYRYTLRLECLNHVNVVFDTITEPVSTNGMASADTGVFENMALDYLVHYLVPRLVRMCCWQIRMQNSVTKDGWSGVVVEHTHWSRSWTWQEENDNDEC